MESADTPMLQSNLGMQYYNRFKVNTQHDYDKKGQLTQKQNQGSSYQ